jgi:protein tyrosine phosphatase
MIKFIKTLPADKKIYVHCAGGEGRTTNFLVLLDIVKNGKKLSLKEILDRQAKLNGAQLDDFAKKEEWRKKLGAQRLQAIEEFYQQEISN